MEPLIERIIQCPYCWEEISILIDTSVSEQEYVEDCSVCCRPISVEVSCDTDNALVNVSAEND